MVDVTNQIYGQQCLDSNDEIVVGALAKSLLQCPHILKKVILVGVKTCCYEW